METITRLPRRLTQLYSDTKTSCDAVVEQDTRNTQPESTALHRKFRIQTDRYVAWGVDWSDNSKGRNGDIDENVEQAGLTDTIASVLGTIKEIIDEAEGMHAASPPASAKTLSEEKRRPVASDPPSWAAADRSRYEDLIKDLTTSVDILYDLSRVRRTRREIGRGHSPSKSVPEPPRPSTAASVFLSPAYSASDLTLINPATIPLNAHTPNVAPRPNLPPRLNPADLVLPEEEPPPYESVGYSSIRVIGQLLSHRNPANPGKADQNRLAETPVLVEYATYDPTYRFNKVPPPTDRLDKLLSILTRLSNERPSQGTLNCLGYFEDPAQPRFGIVFELPLSTFSEADTPKSAEELRPVTLLNVLQTGSKSLHSPNSATPPLEDRFRLAFTLGLTFSKIHEDGFVHKDLNSSNILVFRKNKRQSTHSRALQYALRSPVICSFDLFSEHDFEIRSTMAALNIYRHPDDPKFTGATDRPYGPQFDLYSLGLILLEVGLWQPLADMWKPKYTLHDFKQRVEELYIRRLASKCGTTYMHVVRDCFWAADRIESGAEGAQDISQLYNRVLTRLQRCCMLDESEPGPDASEHIPSSIPTASASPMKRKSMSQPHVAEISSSPSYRSAKRWALEKGSQALERTMSLSKKSPDLSTLSRNPSRSSQHSIRKSISESLRLMSPKEDALDSIDWTVRQRDPLEESGTLIATPSNSQEQSDTSSVYQERVATAASVIQRAWRASRAKPSNAMQRGMTLKDYRDKITTIQKAWRQCKQKRTNTIEALFTDGIRHWPQATLGYPTPEPEVQHIEPVQRSTGYITSSIQIQTDIDPVIRPKLRLFPVKFAPIIIDDWHDNMLPRLERLIERAVKDSDETISIDLVAVGETQDKARPTIFVTCSSVAKVKAILNRRFRYDDTVFDLKVRRGKIRRSKASRSSRQVRPPHRSMMNTDNNNGDMGVMNPWHQQRPLCGASIGAFCRDKHLPPVSYGGVILVDDEPLGMSVHHMLDAPSDDESDADDEVASPFSNGVQLSSATGRNDSYLLSMGTQPGLELESESPWSMDLELSDDEDEPYEQEFDSDFDSDFESMADSTTSLSTRGDLPGVGVEEGKEIKITQPALDDVADDFFPNEEDRDEDHLDSHELGHVYASSGIRRWERDGNKHEIDWALLKLNEDRLQPYNLIQGGRRFCFKPMEIQQRIISSKLEEPVNRRHYSPEEDEYPNGVASENSLGGMNVHCFGRTTGLQGGMIGHAMSAVKIYKRKTFSKSWQVFGRFGMGGDSGAWVVQNGTHAVVGHVLAWCERNHIAYICPMEVLLEDIKRTLGAKRIYLPGSAEQLAYISKQNKNAIRTRGESDMQGLEMRVQGLGLGIDSTANLRSSQSVRAGFGRRSRLELSPLTTSGESDKENARMVKSPMIKSPEAKVGLAAVP